MSIVIHKLPGVDSTLEAKLKGLGIKDSEDLLRVCRSMSAINKLAVSAGLDPKELTRLVHRADLARIRGIGDAYTQLLEAVGVKTLSDLADRQPEDLRDQFNHVNGELKLVGRVPALAMVNGWVTKAQRLHETLE
jgi:predicted flap endonuclease-1-like 5' DNA nuclease